MAVSHLTKIWLWLPCLLAFAGCAAFQRHPVTGVDHVSVYYATTQQYDPTAAVMRAFTNTPTKHEFINFGVAQVSVPLPHTEGVQKGIKVEKIDAPIGPGERDFRAHIEPEIGNPTRPLVVFVHGFNNSFETAAERAALFAHDLQPDVSTKAAIFSWPSHEKLFGYSADEDRVLVSQDRAAQVLRDLRTHDSASPVVLIGHSMGCRVLTFALRDIELIDSKGKPPKPGAPAVCAVDPDRAGCRCGIFQDKHRAPSRHMRTCYRLCIEP